MAALATLQLLLLLLLLTVTANLATSGMINYDDSEGDSDDNACSIDCFCSSSAISSAADSFAALMTTKTTIMMTRH